MRLKIFITGARGYLGSLLVPALASAGHTIIALDLKEPLSSPPDRVESIQGDCTDSETIARHLRKADLIIPLAALVGAPACAQNPHLAQVLNDESIALLNQLRSSSQPVIFPMTNNGYYTASLGTPYADETAPFKTDSCYTQTKFRAEQALLGKGNAVSLRLSSLFGASPSMRWDLLLHTLIRDAWEHSKITLYEGGFKRSFLPLKDAVRAFLFTVEHYAEMRNQIFNVTLESANLTKLEIAQKIKDYFPSLMLETDFRSQDPDGRNFYVSADKIKQIGFRPEHTLDEGILEISQNLRQAQLLQETS